MTGFNGDVPQDIKNIVKERLGPFFDSDIKDFDEICGPIINEMQETDLIDHIKAVFVENVDIYEILSSADKQIFSHITSEHLSEAKRLSEEKKEILKELKDYQAQEYTEDEIVDAIGERCKKYRVDASLLSSENLYHVFRKHRLDMENMLSKQSE